MYKVADIQFDASTWDEKNPEEIVGMTGIMFDNAIEDENHNIHAIGKTDIRLFLDKELAEACEVSLEQIENEIYA